MSRTISLIASLAILLISWLPGWAAMIDTVPVGNAGNAPDELSTFSNPENLRFGAVDYEYRIGKYEVTLGQYSEFLNAVARTDTYGLYVTGMAPTFSPYYMAGIAQSGLAGNYTYSVSGSPDKPVAYVGWQQAARFANWLNNGQPTGLQTASTTEDGAYILNGATTSDALNAVTRNPGAKWFIPSENEWYKAAYHKNDGVTGNYWDYPTSSDLIPYSDQPPGSDAPTKSNTANLNLNDHLVNKYNDGFAVTGSTNFSINLDYRTNVGAYTFTTSPYGTFDQAGNVREWTEGKFFNEFNSQTVRVMRGGDWYGLVGLEATGRGASNPEYGGSVSGFRVATIPEPSSIALFLIATISLTSVGWCQKRRRA